MINIITPVSASLSLSLLLLATKGGSGKEEKREKKSLSTTLWPEVRKTQKLRV